jgi:molybdopterin-guanine dinucleotide biosynthesis protein A
LTQTQRKPITGIILSGGLGRRMQGQDKGLIKYGDKAMIEHVLERIAPQVDALIISANRNFEAYTASGLPVVADERTDYAGPLAGIEAALQKVRTPLALVVPCDTPQLPPDLAERLLAALEQDQADIAIPDDGDRQQPLFCLMKTSLLTSITQALDAGQARVLDWLALQNLTWADFSDQAQAFANINDWDTLESLRGDD